MLKRLSLILMLGMFVLSTAACNTMEGAGEDIEEGGEAVEDIAE